MKMMLQDIVFASLIIFTFTIIMGSAIYTIDEEREYRKWRRENEISRRARKS